MLLCSQPDTVHRFLLRRTRTSMPLIQGSFRPNSPGQDITPTKADCRYRAPPSPRLHGNLMTFLLAILFKNACPVYRLLEGLSNLLHLDFPQFTEKFLEKRRAFFLKDSFGQLHLMIESRHIKKIQDRTGTSGFRIPTSDHDSWNPCLYNGTGTHLTRF